MSLYRTTFLNRHTVLPVIHVVTKEQTLRNMEIAVTCGADGVFLINHNSGASSLIEIYWEVRKEFPDVWVGMNMLGIEPIKAYDLLPLGTDGLWVDDGGIRNSGDCSEAADFFAATRMMGSAWHGLYFGGVAFKYQEDIDDPAQAAKLAVPFIDVITTSGKGTGFAAEVEKIRVMKEAIGSHPLAIASGISPENVRDYLPYADCFLVATDVSDSHTELNSERVRALVDVVRTG
jgi:hypothetical protein